MSQPHPNKMNRSTSQRRLRKTDQSISHPHPGKMDQTISLVDHRRPTNMSKLTADPLPWTSIISEPTQTSRWGTPISIGETLGRQNGSFPKITSCCHLLATASGTELVWIYEAKEHDDNPEGYLKSSTTKDVLHIRHLVLSNPEFASKSLPQFEATGNIHGLKASIWSMDISG